MVSDNMTLKNRQNKDKPGQPLEKPKKYISKKIKQLKKIKDKLRDFKIFYQNLRGLKSKIDFLAKTVSDHDSELICLVEIYLTKEEMIPKPGYKIFRYYGTADIF